MAEETKLSNYPGSDQLDVGGDWNTIMEPPSAANEEHQPLYPYNNVISSVCHNIEMDDTPQRERIRIQHKANTFLEMHPDGTEVHKIWGDGYEIILKNKKVLVKGSCTIAVDGNAAIEVKGNAYNTVKGSYTSVIKGNASITSDSSIYLQAAKNITLAASSIDLFAEKINNFGEVSQHGSLSLNQDVNIMGNLKATGVVIGLMGLGTPGSLLVGPSYALPAAAYLTPPRVDIMTTLVSVLSSTAISATAAAGVSVSAGVGVSIGAGAGVSITAGAGAVVSAAGAVGILAAGAVTVQGGGIATITGTSISLNAAVTNALGAIMVEGLVNVVGIVTAGDFFCIANPTFYSIHSHPPLITPPAIV